MSGVITNKKSSFVIFGHGYDSVRDDSGDGAKNVVLDLTVFSAAIDITGAYAWLVTDDGLKKYSARTWVEVEQNTIPNNAISIFHPSNVSNNYGVAFVPNDRVTDAYIFNLTDDTLITTMTTSVPYSAGGLVDWDCILVNDKIYIINRHYGSNTNTNLLVLDIDNETFDDSTVFGGVGCNGFINNSLVYAMYTREWFYQTSIAYALNFSGGTVWYNEGIDRNSYLHPWGFTGNGKLYLPVLINDKWHYGEFDGTSNPTFSPVSPIRTFGTFDSCPSIAPYISGNERNIYIVYNNGRTKGCALTALGVILTDFSNISIIADLTIAPVAMNDHLIICSDYHNHKLYIYGY